MRGASKAIVGLLVVGPFVVGLVGCGADIGQPGRVGQPDASDRLDGAGGRDGLPDADPQATGDADARPDASSEADASGRADAASRADATRPGDQPDAGEAVDAGVMTPFVERDGYVVMEMESAAIPAGHDWVEESDLVGHTGSSYYRFVGNGVCNGPARSPLTYDFEVTRDATYRLHLRAARYWHCVKGQPHNNNRCEENDRTCTSLGIPNGNDCSEPDQCIRTDISNDAFVHIEDAMGDYVPFNNQPGGSIGKGIKLFGGGNDSWAWTTKNALDTNHKKWAAEWSLEAGRYTLVIQGRSKDFRIDRLLLFDVDTGSTRDAHQRSETRR